MAATADDPARHRHLPRRSGTVAHDDEWTPMRPVPRPTLLLALLSVLLASAGCDGRDPDLEVATNQAIQQAAEDEQVEPDDIRVVSADEVTWRDGAIGCPEPDMAHPQVLVEGFRVVLEVGNERLHYHADDPEAPFRCEEPEEPLEVH